MKCICCDNDQELTVLTLAGKTFNYCGKCGKSYPIEKDENDETTKFYDEDTKIWKESKRYD